ncbi:MAG: GDSL-type esterase/lipase family protein [Fibrobacteria bacterium]
MKFAKAYRNALACAALAAGGTLAQTSYKFDFTPGFAKNGYIAISDKVTYNPAQGYGFDFNVPVTCADRGGLDTLTRTVCYPTGAKYMYFSMKLPEGNYKVTVTLGDGGAASLTTVKAESRRLFVEKADNAAGAFSKHSFIVNRRNTAIAGSSGSVAISDRERGGLNWDGDKLTLEFSNAHPAVTSLEIAPADAPRQIFLAGNSTQCDWATESETAWGQMITRFFKDDAVVVSLAEAGLTGTAFISQRRLAKIMSLIKPGDYLLAEFAHNDMKSLSLAEFQDNFKTFISQARAKNAVPVLVTPTPRHTFSGETPTNSFNTGGVDWLAAVKSVATSESAPLLDLNACATELLKQIGPIASNLFYWYDASPGGVGQDAIHFNRLGALEIAKCLAQGIKTGIPDLAVHLAADFTGFDPAHPDPMDTLIIPASADTSVWHRAVPVSLRPWAFGKTADMALTIDPDAHRVTFFSPIAGDAEFSVFQLDGQRVARKQLQVFPGERTLILDGMRLLPKGLYFLRMKLDGRTHGFIRFLK